MSENKSEEKSGDKAVVEAGAEKDGSQFMKDMVGLVGKVTGATDEKLLKLIEQMKFKHAMTLDTTKTVGDKAFSKFALETHQFAVETEPGEEGMEYLKEDWLPPIIKAFMKFVVDHDLDKFEPETLKIATRRLSAVRSLGAAPIECQTFEGRDGRCAFLRYAYKKARDGCKIMLISFGVLDVQKARSYFLTTVNDSSIFFSNSYQKWTEAPAGSQGWTAEDRANLKDLLKLQIGATMLAIERGTMDTMDVAMITPSL